MVFYVNVSVVLDGTIMNTWMLEQSPDLSYFIPYDTQGWDFDGGVFAAQLTTEVHQSRRLGGHPFDFAREDCQFHLLRVIAFPGDSTAGEVELFYGPSDVVKEPRTSTPVTVDEVDGRPISSVHVSVEGAMESDTPSWHTETVSVLIEVFSDDGEIIEGSGDFEFVVPFYSNRSRRDDIILEMTRQVSAVPILGGTEFPWPVGGTFEYLHDNIYIYNRPQTAAPSAFSLSGIISGVQNMAKAAIESFHSDIFTGDDGTLSYVSPFAETQRSLVVAPKASSRPLLPPRQLVPLPPAGPPSNWHLTNVFVDVKSGCVTIPKQYTVNLYLPPDDPKEGRGERIAEQMRGQLDHVTVTTDLKTGKMVAGTRRFGKKAFVHYQEGWRFHPVGDSDTHFEYKQTQTDGEGTHPQAVASDASLQKSSDRTTRSSRPPPAVSTVEVTRSTPRSALTSRRKLGRSKGSSVLIVDETIPYIEVDPYDVSDDEPDRRKKWREAKRERDSQTLKESMEAALTASRTSSDDNVFRQSELMTMQIDGTQD